MKNSPKFMFLTICIILLFGTVYADVDDVNVSFTQEELEYIQNNQNVYIAGNPNLFPIEYYSKDKKKYEGIIPDYLDIVTKLSGINFTYVNNSRIDSRYNLAKNNQVEILSALEYDVDKMKEYNLFSGNTLISMPDDKEIILAYTNVAPKELISVIDKCINSITKEQKSDVFLKNSMNYRASIISYKLIIFIITLISLIIIISYIFAIKKIKAKNKKINQFINTDKITGYYNLTKLKEKYNEIIIEKSSINYYLVNLDINMDNLIDIYGIKESTDIFKNAANIINNTLNGEDFFATLNNMHFAVLLKCSSLNILNDKLNKINDSILKDVFMQEVLYDLNLSMGVCQFNQYEKDIDIPLYKAIQANKYARTNNVLYYIYEKSIESQLKEESTLEQELMQGLLNNEFVVYLQPYYATDNEIIKGCEALVRWENSRLGLIKPNKFLPILEKKNMIDKLDIIVFEQVCKIIANRRKQNKKIFWVSCNFSKQNFLNPDFAKTLLKIAIKHEVPTKYLLIEISEGLEIGSKDQNDIIIKQLNSYGFPLVIDNFGTGYSSFIDLSNYPISFVKFDKNLIDNLGTNNMNTLTKGLLDIIHNINIKIMCSGVEKKEQVDLIKQLKFDFIQGHFYYQPMYYEKFEQLFDKDN